MLYVIGLGLSDERDITVKGLDAVKSCERIYLEAYTSILMVDKEKLVRLPLLLHTRSVTCYLLFKYTKTARSPTQYPTN